MLQLNRKGLDHDPEAKQVFLIKVEAVHMHQGIHLLNKLLQKEDNYYINKIVIQPNVT